MAAQAAARGRTGVQVGGRVTWEDAHAYAARGISTNDIDFCLAALGRGGRLPGGPPGGIWYRCADLESAPVGKRGGALFKTSRRSFLQLRKAARRHRRPAHDVSFANCGLHKCRAG